jgi:hypothetical protein
MPPSAPNCHILVPGRRRVKDAGVAPVQEPPPIETGLDVEMGPDLAVDQHDVAEVLADPGRARNVAGRVEEGAVVAEKPILDHQRHLECACRIGLAYSVVSPRVPTDRSNETSDGVWWNVERMANGHLRLTVETISPRGTVEFELDPTTAQELSDALRRETIGG